MSNMHKILPGQRLLSRMSHTLAITQMAENAANDSKASQTLKITPISNDEKGQSNYGWLKSSHTFSVPGYENAKYQKWGHLRVINEDRVAAQQGFNAHSHKEFEIFSYIVSGELEHRDSLSNVEILKRGDIQMTSAGTGIVHSEVAHGPNPVHFVQIWATPQDSGLTPSYYTRHFTEEDKRDKLLPVVAPLGSVVRSAGTNETTVSEMREGDGPTPIHSPIWLYATILSPGKLITHSLHMPEKDSVGRKAYVQIVQTSGYNSRKAKGNGIRINASVDIYEGDGTFIEGLGGEEITFENIGQGDVEVLVFDLA